MATAVRASDIQRTTSVATLAYYPAIGIGLSAVPIALMLDAGSVFAIGYAIACMIALASIWMLQKSEIRIRPSHAPFADPAAEAARRAAARTDAAILVAGGAASSLIWMSPVVHAMLRIAH